MTRLEAAKMAQSGRLLVGKAALDAFSGMQRFTSARDLLAAVRKDVMLKWQAQHHEMELSDYDQTHGFIGTPEW